LAGWSGGFGGGGDFGGTLNAIGFADHQPDQIALGDCAAAQGQGQGLLFMGYGGEPGLQDDAGSPTNLEKARRITPAGSGN